MTDRPAQNRNSSAVPHSLVYRGILLLAAGFVIAAAWGFSADAGYIRLALCVVTGLVVMAVTLSSVLAWISRRDRRRQAEPKTATSFLDWARGQLGTSNGNISAFVAAIEILLPIVAAVIGLTALAIIRDIVAS